MFIRKMMGVIYIPVIRTNDKQNKTKDFDLRDSTVYIYTLLK